MSEEIKFIVGELNKPPYNRNYNLISFDGLNAESLLQVGSQHLFLPPLFYVLFVITLIRPSLVSISEENKKCCVIILLERNS